MGRDVAGEALWCFYIYGSMSSTKVQVTDEFVNLLLSTLFSFLLPWG